MNKRIFSALLIFIIVFSFMPVAMGNSHTYAVNSGEEIRVRIEGKDGTLFDHMIVVSDEVSGEDLLRTAIGDDEIDGEVSQYGLLITGLLGETVGDSGDGYSTSWGLYVAGGGVLESSQVGISSLQLEGLEELLLHVKAFNPSTYEDLTFIPRLETIQEGSYTKLIVKKAITTYDENWNPVISEEIVEGANLEIDGDVYTTDENGEVEIELEEGIYYVDIFKEGENYPELVRETYEIVVESNKFEEDDSNYELWTVDNSNVKVNKEWNIKFNEEVLDSSLEDNIIVVDSDKNIVTGELELLEDNKTIRVYPPGNGYSVGESYGLYIKNEIESVNGKVLNKSWKVEFTIGE